MTTDLVTGTPLESVLREHGGVIAVRHGRRVAAHFGSVAGETAVCVRSVGLADRFGRVTLDVRGAKGAIDAAVDRTAGTCAVARLGANHAVVRCDPGDEPACRGRLADDDLHVADDSDAYAAIGLVGPRAGAALERARLDEAPFEAIVVTDGDGCEILVPRRYGAQAWVHLLQAGRPVGIAFVGFDALEHLHVARHGINADRWREAARASP